MAEDDSILPSQGLYFDSTLQGIYEDAINQLIIDLGYVITLYLSPSEQDCPNCLIGPDGRSNGIYDSSNPNTINTSLHRYFPNGATCPVCGGAGKLKTQSTKQWHALIGYNPEEWDMEETGIDRTEIVRLKTRIEAEGDITSAEKALVEGSLYQLQGDPVKRGLQGRRFLLSFWRRIE